MCEDVQMRVLAPFSERKIEATDEDRLREMTPLCTQEALGMAENLAAEDTSTLSPLRHLQLQVALLTALWWTAAVLVVLYMKRTLTLFHHPFVITWLCNWWCGLMALCIAMVVHPKRLPPFRRDEVLKLIAIGMINGVEIGCCNKALEFLSVSSSIMLGSVKVLFQMTTCLCWGLEHITWRRVLAGLIFIVGGLLQGYEKQTARDDEVTSVQGVVMQLCAVAIGSQRFACLQYVMQRADCDSALGQMSKFQLVGWVLPTAGVVCLCLAAVFEGQSLRYEQLLQPQLILSTLLLASGVITLVISELKIVQLTSAVALQVLMTLHSIPIVLAGVLFLKEEVSLISILGFVACLVAALLYGAARNLDDESQAMHM